MSATEHKPLEMFLLRRRRLTMFSAWLLFVFGVGLPLAVWFGLHTMESDVFILLFVGSLIWGIVAIVLFALTLRNALNPYILYANADGVYDYSGFIHGGFIAWSDIGCIALGKGGVADIVNTLDGNAPCIRIYFKDADDYLTRTKFLRRILIILGGGCIMVRTTFAKAKRREVYAMLVDFAGHYLTGKGAGNGKG